MAAEKAAAMKDEADAPAEGAEEETKKANEEDDDENDDDLFGDGDALYGSDAREEEAGKIEESSNGIDDDKLDEQSGDSKDRAEEKDDHKLIYQTDVESTEEAR